MKQKINFAKANVKYFKFKFLKYILTFLGVFLGFSNTIFAQYGNWVDYMNNFKIRGRVFSESTQTTIPNLKINNTVTNKDGEFVIEQQTYDNYIDLFIEDIDGNENGSYAALDSTIIFKEWSEISFDIYLKKEPDIDQYLKNNNDIPLTFDDETIDYLDFVYINNNYISIKCDKKDIIYINNKPFDPSKFSLIDSKYVVMLDQEKNYLVVDKKNYESKDYDLIINEQKFNIKKAKKKHSGIIIVKM